MAVCTLLVFARAPVAGQVKTRLFRADPATAVAALGRMLDADDAARLHAAFVDDVLCKGASAGFSRRVLYAADREEHPALTELARVHGYERQVQRGVDLGARMATAIADQLGVPQASVGDEGSASSSVVLIGTDSPTLPVAYLREAATALGQGMDVVLGPACDGGYYLIGMRRPLPDLFPTDMPWGTAEVLPRTLSILRMLAKQGLRCHLLPFFNDCDTPSDLRLLRDQLALAAQRDALWHGDPAQAIHADATAAVLRQLSLL